MPHRLAVGLALCLAALAPAQKPTHAVTVEDYFSLAAVTDLAVSPDGKRVVYAEARWDRKENNRKSDLWGTWTSGENKPVRLTSDRANDRHIRWAPDGVSVFVL